MCEGLMCRRVCECMRAELNAWCLPWSFRAFCAEEEPGVFLGLSVPSVLKKNLSLARGVPTWLVPHCSWNSVPLPPRCWDYRQPLYLPDTHMDSGDPDSGP